MFRPQPALPVGVSAVHKLQDQTCLRHCTTMPTNCPVEIETRYFPEPGAAVGKAYIIKFNRFSSACFSPFIR